ncbi:MULTISPECIES: WD40 repeat domain-containing protein [unclassified Streptomyces]|uniref:WD40 repeat domain-containing protein n=1 Tax=unclassified Streptomyces TaxID=2593676 RepID=UPI0036F0E2E4
MALTNPTLVTCIEIDPNGNDFFVGQAANNQHSALSRWSLPDLSPLQGPKTCPLAMQQDTCHVLTRGGSNLLGVVGISTQRLTLIDLVSGSQSEPVEDNVVWARMAGPYLATSGTHTQIQELKSGNVVWRQEPPAPRKSSHASLVPMISFHPNLHVFATGGSGESEVRLHSLTDESLTDVLPEAPKRLRWLDFSPNGDYVIAIDAYAKSTVIWDSRTKDLHRPEIFGRKADDYWSVAFHPDGEHFAMGMLSGYVNLFRLSDGQRVGSQRQHIGRVQALVFSPDGSLLLSGGDDGQVLAWTLI